MSLQVWLPLNGNLDNLGLDGTKVPSLMGTGITYSTGKIGQAATFPNNCNSCIHMDGLKLQIFSWACWFKVLGEGSGTSQRFMSEGRDTGSVGTNLWVSKDGTTLSWSTHKKSGNIAISLNTWYHVVLTADGSNIKFYLNGELKSTTAYIDDSDYTQSQDKLVLGKMSYSYTNTSTYFPFNGQLNDVRIYDHALSAKEVEEISKGLVLHYKLDNNGLGNLNLLDNTNQGSNYWLQSYGNGAGSLVSDGIAAKYNITTQSTNWQVFAFRPSNNAAVMNSLSIAGKTYTLSFDIYATSSFTTNPTYRDGNSQNNLITWPSFTTITNQWYHYEGSATTIGGTVSNQEIYINYKVPVGTYIFKNLKLEEGNKATPWSPYVNTNTIYDVSGYNHAATANAITWSSSSPRYNAAAGFNGSSSYIKIDDNSWMAQGSTALTVNIWAYMNDWTSWNGHRLYSCTESGGFNIENTITNSLTFPVCVYTNAGQTSIAYIDTNSRAAILKTDITSGWHMFTYVYETTGCSCYLDGELYQTKPYTSYGIHYNISGSKLFLGCEAGGTSPSGPYFNGQESDFRVYATALSADDIKELYNTSAAIDQYGNVYAREVIEI